MKLLMRKMFLEIFRFQTVMRDVAQTSVSKNRKTSLKAALRKMRILRSTEKRNYEVEINFSCMVDTLLKLSLQKLFSAMCC